MFNGQWSKSCATHQFPDPTTVTLCFLSWAPSNAEPAILIAACEDEKYLGCGKQRLLKLREDCETRIRNIKMVEKTAFGEEGRYMYED